MQLSSEAAHTNIQPLDGRRQWAEDGFLAAQSDAIKKLKKAFDESGITIPFPIRTLDFGVVGGERLDETLPHRMYGET